MFRSRGAASATQPPGTPRRSSRSGALSRDARPPGPGRPRTPRRRPAAAIARIAADPDQRLVVARIDDAGRGCRAPDARAALAGALRHGRLRHAPAGPRRVPPARRRPRADGGHGQLGRGEGHRARRRRGLGRAPATPTASWPGSASARSPSCAAPPSGAAGQAPARAAGRGPRRHPQPPQRRAGARPAPLACAARRPAPPEPPALLAASPAGGAARLGWRTCPTSLPHVPDPTPPVRACCCSTATRWPTARSSRCRSRTSRPPPASTPTRSTASPRC